MTERGDYTDDMAEDSARDELLDLLPARGERGAVPPPLTDILMQLQALGDVPPHDAVASRHLAMLKNEAAPYPVEVPAPKGSTGPLLSRWKTATAGLLSGVLVNLLIGTAAFAAIGTGAAAASDAAAPGDLLYSLDRAFERLGINDGGATERIDEAMRLVDRGKHDQALDSISEAIDDLAASRADQNEARALEAASEQIAAIHASQSTYKDTEDFDDRVTDLVDVITTEVDDDQGSAEIEESVRDFSESALPDGDDDEDGLEGDDDDSGGDQTDEEGVPQPVDDDESDDNDDEEDEPDDDNDNENEDD